MPTRQVTIQGVMTWEDPYPSQGPGFPTHPIAPGGGVPPGYWGGVAPPYPDQGLPGRPPYPSQGPGFPTNPIAPGGPPPGVWIPAFPTNPIAPGGTPPGYWGGVAPPYPSQGLPGSQPGVDNTLPGSQPGVDNTLPGAPPGYWGGVAPPWVSNPISGGGYIVGWSPITGPVFIPIGGAPPAGSGQPPVVDNTLPEPESK